MHVIDSRGDGGLAYHTTQGRPDIKVACRPLTAHGLGSDPSSSGEHNSGPGSAHSSRSFSLPMDSTASQMLQSASLAGLPENKAQLLRKLLQRQLTAAKGAAGTPEASLLANAQNPLSPASSQVPSQDPEGLHRSAPVHRHTSV